MLPPTEVKFGYQTSADNEAEHSRVSSKSAKVTPYLLKGAEEIKLARVR